MPRSLPTKDVMTVTDPPRNEPMAIAMVAVRTKRISTTVDLKHAGRASGSTIGATCACAMFFSSKATTMSVARAASAMMKESVFGDGACASSRTTRAAKTWKTLYLSH